jgi:hypothetical protein
VTTWPLRSGSSTSEASAGSTSGPLPMTALRPVGSTKQAPSRTCTGVLPSSVSQQEPWTTA